MTAAPLAALIAIPVALTLGTGTTPPAGAAGLRLPATFRGNLPCADCETVRHHLDLWPDQVFHLHREWVGRGMVRDEVGRWSVDAARAALILDGGGEMPLQFEIRGEDRLRLLDMQRRPIDSPLAYELVSNGSLTPVDLSLALGGEMTCMADAARFVECRTGRGYPIAMEGDFIKLQSAYRDNAREAGTPLYVTFEGSIADRPDAEGTRTVRTVIVRRFIGAWPGQRCERARAQTSLINTYWRIVRLTGEAVGAEPGRREAHLLLRTEGGTRRYQATVGCNALTGAFASEGETIRFTPATTTLLPCPDPLGAAERRLGEGLARARRFRITAQTLELFDEAGTPVALLEAVSL